MEKKRLVKIFTFMVLALFLVFGSENLAMNLYGKDAIKEVLQGKIAIRIKRLLYKSYGVNKWWISEMQIQYDSIIAKESIVRLLHKNEIPGFSPERFILL